MFSVDQPIGTFYIGAIEALDLVAISWADIRRIAPKDPDLLPVQDTTEYPQPIDSPREVATQRIEDMDEDIVPIEDQGFERFLGIQRELTKSRVKEIQKYVETVDATFPTAVLLAVSSNHARYDPETATMTIVRHSRAAKIIDGQHRIAGLRNYSGPPFQVNVAVFVDMDIQDQAMVFATINLKQTKVNKSLAYDLYEFTTSRSPQKTCHDIVRFLDNRDDSPFFGKIKMLGTAIGPTEIITQATFVDRLLRFISHDPMGDRDQIKRNRPLNRASGMEARRQIFRNMFIDGRDVDIARVVWNYFSAVQHRWPMSWSLSQRGNILNRTTGFGALMRFLRIAYFSVGAPEEVVDVSTFRQIFEGIDLPDSSFTPETYLPGSSGETSPLSGAASKIWARHAHLAATLDNFVFIGDVNAISSVTWQCSPESSSARGCHVSELLLNPDRVQPVGVGTGAGAGGGADAWRIRRQTAMLDPSPSADSGLASLGKLRMTSKEDDISKRLPPGRPAGHPRRT